ncbi:nuclear transport factor 2 family protein, partial [bacterium]
MHLVFLPSLVLGGEKPQVTAAMNAERRLAAAFSEGLFDAHRKLLSPSFRFYSEGEEPVGRTAFIENLTQYRNGFVTGKQTVRLVWGAVRGNLI